MKNHTFLGTLATGLLIVSGTMAGMVTAIQANSFMEFWFGVASLVSLVAGIIVAIIALVEYQNR